MAPAGCPSGTGQYGHTIAVAPEQSGTRWLVSDPWCSPPKWTWIEEALLREAAETWGGMCYGEATAGRGSLAEALLRALMRLAAKRIMSAHRPDAPAVTPPPADTAGAAGRIMFTTTHGPEPEAEEGDMPINAAPGLATGIRARVRQGVEWFEDPNLTRRGGAMSIDADVFYVGAPVGETVEGGSYAIQVNTGSLYGDGSVRPTIVYVAAGDADTYSVPPVIPPDVDAVLEERDEEWRTWLLEGAPGSAA